MTADKRQSLDLQMDFLGPGSFEAKLYEDDPANGPTAVTRRTRTVEASDELRVVMAPSGGFAARLKIVEQ